MELLNLIFGIIGLVSFAYAVWVNRNAVAARALTSRLTGNVRQLARTILDLNYGVPTEGYARSIMHICDSLLSDGTDAATPKIGEFWIRYATCFPPMQTNVGIVIDEPLSLVGRAVVGERVSTRKQALVFGPYEKLPAIGSYEALFSLRVQMSHGVDPPPEPTSQVVGIEVYNYAERRWIAERRLTLEEAESEDYVRHRLAFYLDDVSAVFEYRVVIVHAAVRVWCDQVIVHRISD